MPRLSLQTSPEGSVHHPPLLSDCYPHRPPPSHAGITGEQHAASVSESNHSVPFRLPIPQGASDIACVHASECFSTADRFPWRARPRTQFSFCGAISVSAISQYMVPRQNCTHGHIGTCASACVEYQHAMCEPHHVQPSEVCWFQNFPHSLPSCGSISVSECARTPECQLSANLWFQLLSAEAMMLNQEYDMLRAARDPTWHAPAHSFQTPQNLSRAPMRPADALLSKLFLRCGVNERFQLEHAATEVCSLLQPNMDRGVSSHLDDEQFPGC